MRHIRAEALQRGAQVGGDGTLTLPSGAQADLCRTLTFPSDAQTRIGRTLTCSSDAQTRVVHHFDFSKSCTDGGLQDLVFPKCRNTRLAHHFAK